jgi:hypothetical protein
MYQMCGVFAEFERAMIVERVNAGLARAKPRGIKLGRGNKKDRAAALGASCVSANDGTGMLTSLGIGTALVQGVVTEQPRRFEVGVALRKHMPISESKIANTRHRYRPAGIHKRQWPLPITRVSNRHSLNRLS